MYAFILFAAYRVAVSNQEVSQWPIDLSDLSQDFSVCGYFTSLQWTYAGLTCPERYSGQYVYLISQPRQWLSSYDIKIYGEVVIENGKSQRECCIFIELK